MMTAVDSSSSLGVCGENAFPGSTGSSKSSSVAVDEESTPDFASDAFFKASSNRLTVSVLQAVCFEWREKSVRSFPLQGDIV